jgi:hypothetical protein
MEAHQHLENWLQHPGDNFHNLLFHMISKADRVNREKLRMGFPWELMLWEMWQESPSEEAFEEKMKYLQTLRAPRNN